MYYKGEHGYGKQEDTAQEENGSTDHHSSFIDPLVYWNGDRLFLYTGDPVHIQDTYGNYSGSYFRCHKFCISRKNQRDKEWRRR